MAPTIDLMIGGAMDPAEKAADARANRALSTAPTIRRKCADCEAEETARRTPAAGIVAPGTASAPASQSTASVVRAMGPGRPLSSPERAFYEPRLRADLAPVRLHEDAAADEAARAMGASAFTLGADVAFASGARERGGNRLIAHELAHVAEGGGPVRRKLKVDQDSEGFGAGLAADFGARSIEIKDGALTSNERKKSGDLQAQVAQNMLASPRLLEIKGATTEDATDHFHIHLATRLAIVDYAKAFNIGFTTGAPKVDEAKWKLFEEHTQAVKDKIKADMTAEGKTEEEIAAYITSVISDIFLLVFNESIHLPEFNDMLDDVRAKSEAYENSGDPDKSYAYSMACFRASMVVMFTGGRDRMKLDMLDNIHGRKDDKTTMAWTDWAPGDWGYIQNTGGGAKAPGLEGENVISIGDTKFWGHFDPKTPIKTLQAFFDMVESWNGGAEITPQRVYPTTGL